MNLLRVNPQAILTELDDDSGVLLHTESKFFYTLNATGLYVWKWITHREVAAAPDITEALVGEFIGAEPEAVAKDVEGLIDELVAEKLLLPASEQPSER